MKKPVKKEKPSVIEIRIPDLGLSSKELEELKKAFDNALVTTASKLTEKRAQRTVTFPPTTIKLTIPPTTGKVLPKPTPKSPKEK